MTDPAAPTTPEPFNFVRDTDGVLVQDDRHKIGHWLPAWAYHALRSKWQSEAEAGSRLGSTTGNAGLTPSRDVSDGLELRDAPSASSTPAEALDVERLTEAMDFDRVEALSIIKKHGFVFATDLSKPIENRTNAERWEALAFTLYTMLLPSNRRSERIAAEYARLRSPESDR